MNRHHARVILIVFTLAAGGSGLAADFAGGTGAPNDPYQIATAEQLLSIGSDPGLLASHFVMTGDIDLDPNLSEDYVFDRPIIGTFSGVFDGNAHRIRRLTLVGDAGEGPHRLGGLFERIDYRGAVKRLVLEDVAVCVTSAYGYTAALCGENRGIVLRCCVTGIVDARNTVGGLVGVNDRGGRVEECRSVCVVSGKWSGGLIGANYGNAQDCRACGHVSGERAGGLVGEHLAGQIGHCYAACNVENAGPYSGGLVGLTTSPAILTTLCYFLHADDGGGPDNGIGTSLTSDQMKDPSNFVGWDFWGVGNNGFRIAWFMPEDGYPALVWPFLEAMPDVSGSPLEEAYAVIEDAGIGVNQVVLDYDPAVEYGHVVATRPYPGARPGTTVDIVLSLGPYDWYASPGSGNSEHPYLIFSIGQLTCLASQPELWNCHFRLISDIDMAWRVYGGPLIGRYESNGTTFDGAFDGNGHLVKDLTIEEGADRSGLLGLFGEIGELGHVRDLGLPGICVTGREDREAVGGMLCGVNGGVVERCYCQGALQGHGRLGGLVGKNAGVIEDCYAQGAVEDLAGRGDKMPDAGLVGVNVTGTIRTCYATCFVLSRDSAGLVASNESGVVENCLWDVETSWADTSDGGTGLTTQELMSLEVLRREGWGGSPNWIVDDGNDYPRLIWEGTPGRLIPESLNGARR